VGGHLGGGVGHSSGAVTGDIAALPSEPAAEAGLAA
jgi:hypothetical protein